MKYERRQVVKLIGATAIAALLPLGAMAQAGKKMTILVGFPPGGAPDTVARALGAGLQSQNYNAIVVNKTGAGGRLASDTLLAAPADGTTVMIVPGGSLTIYPHIYQKLRYDLDDFVPLATVGAFSFAMAVGPAVPASVKTVQDFLAWAKANPKQAQFGSPGAGTAMHFIGIELARAAKLDFQHIPYRGGAPAIADVMGGTVPAVFTTLPVVVKPHQAGKLRILAQSGENRSKALPDVPTFKEAGFPALTMSELFVIVAAATTPAPVQRELATALTAAASTGTVKDALAAAEFDSLTLAPAEISARLKSDHKRWGALVKSTGYKAED